MQTLRVTPASPQAFSRVRPGRGPEPEGRFGPSAALGTITVNNLSELASVNLIIFLLSVFFFPSYCFVFVLRFDSVV